MELYCLYFLLSAFTRSKQVLQYSSHWIYLLNAFFLLGLVFIIYILVKKKNRKFEKILIHMNERYDGLEKIKSELEEKLKKKTLELENFNQLISVKNGKENISNQTHIKFISKMNHEVRSLINTILGFSEILEKRIEDRDQKNFLLSVSSSGRKLLSVLNDMFDFFRIEAGKKELNYEPVNLQTILNEVSFIYSSQLRDTNVALYWELDENIPEYILLDRRIIRQILINLIAHFISFTQRESIKISAFMRNQNSSSSEIFDLIFTIQIKDIQFSEGDSKNISHLFPQGEISNLEKCVESGIGLTMAFLLTKVLGGVVSINRNSKNDGITFQVSLVNVGSTKEIVNVKNSKKMEDGKKKEIDFLDTFDKIAFEYSQVLIVDDQELSRLLLTEYLEYPGIHFLEAEDGKVALKMIKRHHPHLILMDMDMPVMSGIEVIQIIKKDESLRSIPVIAITGYGTEEQRLKVKEVGGDIYLEKPINQEELLKIILRFLPLKKTSEKSPKSLNDETMQSKVNETASKNIVLKEKEINFPELLKVLELKLTPRWIEICQTFFIDDINDFSKEINALADRYPITELEDWGNQLFREINAFNMQKVTTTLGYFPMLVDRIKELSINA